MCTFPWYQRLQWTGRAMHLHLLCNISKWKIPKSYSEINHGCDLNEQTILSISQISYQRRSGFKR